jgi:anti-sigma factor RsiW
MKCKDVRDGILSDYLDGEMQERQKKELEAHLSSCGRCREFERTVRRSVGEPLRGAERFMPREAVWQKIRERIAEEETISPADGFLRRMKALLAMPKPAMAAAGVLVTALFVALLFLKSPFHHPDRATATFDKEADYIVSLMEGSQPFSVDDEEGYGTAIEEYFL